MCSSFFTDFRFIIIFFFHLLLSTVKSALLFLLFIHVIVNNRFVTTFIGDWFGFSAIFIQLLFYVCCVFAGISNEKLNSLNRWGNQQCNYKCHQFLFPATICTQFDNYFTTGKIDKFEQMNVETVNLIFCDRNQCDNVICSDFSFFNWNNNNNYMMFENNPFNESTINIKIDKKKKTASDELWTRIK